MTLVRRILPAAVLAALAGPAAAADPPPELARVPRDAALFVHADVAALWAGKPGDAVRAAKIPAVEQALAEAEKYTGVTPEDVKTVSFFMPQLKGPGDQLVEGIAVTLKKPVDRAKVVAGMAFNKQKYVEKPEGVFILDGPRGDAKDDPTNKVVIDLRDPTRVVGSIGLDPKRITEPGPAPKSGPLDPAIAAAVDGATLVVGVTFANFPDEIRGDDVPAEVRPFQPLFRSDVMVGVGRLAGTDLKLDVRFRNADKAKTLDAEKSLAAGVALMQLGLAAAIQQLEREQAKDRPEAAFLPLAKAAADAVKTARVSVDGTDAVATATVPTDLPVAPLLREAFGGASSPRTAAARSVTQNNLKQLGLAMHIYHDTFTTLPSSAVIGKKGKPLLSWRVTILPYVEQDALYQKFKLDEPWDSAHNKKVLDENPMPPVFRLVGVTKDGDKATHFQVFTGNGALFDKVLGVKLTQIPDGTIGTLMIATAAKAVPWTAPDDIAFDPKADPKDLLLFQDDKGTNVCFADGSVRYLAKAITPEALRAVITKAGGEVTGDLP